MNLWKVLFSNDKVILIVFISAILIATSTSCGLATPTPYAIISTSTPQPSATSSVIPSATPSLTPPATPTIPATETAVPVPPPQFWIENHQTLEAKGYSLQSNLDGFGLDITDSELLEKLQRMILYPPF